MAKLLELGFFLDGQYQGGKLKATEVVTTAGVTAEAHISSKANPHEVTKEQVGLGDVENLAPADLPVSNATQEAITGAKNDVLQTITEAIEALNVGDLKSAVEALQALIKSDDIDLDTVQEIVNYIKANRDDLTLLGTGKLDKTDVVNTLTETSTGKALDARQGKALAALIDALQEDKAEKTDVYDKDEVDEKFRQVEAGAFVAACAVTDIADIPPNMAEGGIVFLVTDTGA